MQNTRTIGICRGEKKIVARRSYSLGTRAPGHNSATFAWELPLNPTLQDIERNLQPRHFGSLPLVRKT